MSIWHDSPNEGAAPPNYQIIRTPAKKPIRLLVLSREMVGAKLHYFRGRSIPCSGLECPACVAGQIARWKGYLYVIEAVEKRPHIFEFTSRGYEPLDQYYTEHGSLRGAKLTARRLNKKDNGPIVIELDEDRIENPNIPDPPDLKGALMRMWELNNAPEESLRGNQYDGTLTGEEL